MSANDIGLLIIWGYFLALWWLLRHERVATLGVLAALCGLSLALRVLLAGDYPNGLNEDEPKNLVCSVQAAGRGELWSESCNGPPFLLSVGFAVPLSRYIGMNGWSMRAHSMATSVLATLAAYAAARALGLRVGAGLAAGGLVAVLPWALYYGRITLGGELIFHQLLLLAGLGRLVWQAGGLVDVLLAAFGLCLLMWDYFAGRVMLGMPIVAAVLARGWRRLGCLLVLPLALLGWYPHLLSGPHYAGIGFSFSFFHPAMLASPLQAATARTLWTLKTFVWPMAWDHIFTVAGAAMHPIFLLVLAGIGVLTGVRRGLFLLGGFVGGIVPGIVSDSPGLSAHRIMMAYVFVSLAASSALDILPWRRLRGVAIAATLTAATVWSVQLYFSPRFWSRESRGTFDVERTALMESLDGVPPPPRMVVMHQVGDYAPKLPASSSVDILTADNWLPPDYQAATYVFSWQGGRLLPQYDHMLPRRVRPVSTRSFLVNFEAADWSWLRRFGWGYTAACVNDDGAGQVDVQQVPFLYTVMQGSRNMRCARQLTTQWRAHWHGPATPMELHFSGRAIVESRDLRLEHKGFEQRLLFDLPADVDVTVTLITEVPNIWPYIVLHEVLPSGLRIPDWDLFTPLWSAETSLDLPQGLGDAADSS